MRKSEPADTSDSAEATRGSASIAQLGASRAERAHTELFENAFHYAPVAMALVSLEGRFLRLNGAFCRLVDFPEAELLATDFQTITHPEDLSADLALLRQLMAGEIDSYAMEKRYIRRGGRVVWVALNVSMVRHRDGAPKHFIAQVQDLTERREVEGRYRLLAENCSDMIVTTSLDGRTTFVSPSAATITGWSAAELIGGRPLAFAHPDDREALRDAFVRVAAGETGLRIRWRAMRKSGDWVWVESSPGMLLDGSPSGQPEFLDVIRDCSAQVTQEQALAAATVAAQSAAIAKSTFLANMSHEIRTPLTAVIGFSGLLAAERLDAKARHFAERIGSASRGLLAVVNDILDFSKLEAGEYEINARPERAAEVGREAVAMLRAQGEAKGLTLDFVCDDGSEAMRLFDPDRLRQVLLNLVGNAVKFTDAGVVSLQMEAVGHRLQVRVADTGPGLDVEQQTRLFGRFSQVDGSPTRRHGGTGLGLAISKGFVEAMGGEIGVTSEPGVGSAFHFFIEAPPVIGHIEAAPSEPAPVKLEGLRVLVADDNSINRELVRALLEPARCRLSEARDGDDAVAVAATTPFDVIIMDLRMPGMNGDEALMEIRRRSGPNQATPIVCFSAAGESVEAGSGFAAVVAKPVSAVHLLQAIAACARGGAPQGRAIGAHRPAQTA